jgi:hypothetical protein
MKVEERREQDDHRFTGKWEERDSKDISKMIMILFHIMRTSLVYS